MSRARRDTYNEKREELEREDGRDAEGRGKVNKKPQLKKRAKRNSVRRINFIHFQTNRVIYHN